MPDELAPLPNAPNVEQNILGAMMLSTQATSRAIALGLSADCFYKNRNKLIYYAICQLYDSQSPTSLPAVVQELTNKKKLDEAGGAEYVADVAASVGTSMNIEYHVKEAIEYSVRRKAIITAQMMAKDAADTTKRVYEVIGVHQEKLFGLLSDNVHTGFVSVSETLPKVFDEMDEIAKRNGAIVGIRTGFNSIDSVLGGLENGELVIVAARPGVGKTSMLMNIATFLGDLNMTCGLFSLEMTRAELVKRMISSVANVDSSRIRGGLLTREEWDIVNPAVNRCSKMSIYIDETSRIRTSEMRAKATRLVKEKGAKLILVDYLQLMRMAERVENRTQEVGQVAQELKAIAKDLNVPVIAAAQLRRIDEMTGRQSRRPTLQDLRESGEIEQVADKVLMLHQPELEIIKQRVMIEGASMPDLKTEVIIAKNRNGRVTTVLLNYHPQTTTFFDYKATAQLASAPVRFFNEPQEDDDSPV